MTRPGIQRQNPGTLASSSLFAIPCSGFIGRRPALGERRLTVTGGARGVAGDLNLGLANRKKELVLPLLRGEPVDAISREVSVPMCLLEEGRDRALAGMDAGLKERENEPLEAKLGEATRRIGELVMEVEILHKERQARHPLGNRRSSK